MKKGKIITLSIIAFLIAIASILFGVVFCLRNQDVKVLGDYPLNISREELISTANIKKGKSIFMIDKETAINNIESKYPYVKVVQIKTTNLTSIEIRVRARHEMFYTKSHDNCYILDEELKVLNIVPIANETELSNLSFIKENQLNIPASTLKCDFIGKSWQQNTTYNLFVSMSRVVTKKVGKEEVYLSRADISKMLRTIEFETFKSFNTITIKTNYGVELSIEKPEINLEEKINICFSTINQFVEEKNGKEKSGLIKIYYDESGVMKTIYIKE